MANYASNLDRSGILAANSLLSTKLFTPQVRPFNDFLPRPRLTDRLTSGLARKLTLISAPAGYGKTNLVAEWVPQCGRTVAWFSLDESDNELSRFLTYVIVALQQLGADFGQSLLASVQSPQLPPLEAL